ncbi:MAG: mannose-1-phosphate guanylyltransferase [Propionibacteriaceae bacterium]|jgi:mannose-1-phosphate guanylyltransferase|nr:mannose-1-phosphate guanylyltransferase [Propionibacteriaceae bacterium]
MRHIVILAGGSGTRLWPWSRRDRPKQLLSLIEGRSLLQLAYQRARALVDDDHILVCGAAAQLDQVAAQLPRLPAANLLGEPVGRDSLNAVAWSTAVVAARQPEAVLAVLSADHIIEPLADFAATLDTALSAAERDQDALVTLGVVPTAPQTGFGYLHRGRPAPGLEGVWRLLEFAEKPDRELAQAYLRAGDWWWNSGLFCWRAATFWRQLEALRPVTAQAVAQLVARPESLGEVYPGLEAISLDYAIMEPVSHGLGSAHLLAVPLTAGWDDVGGFPALGDHLQQRDGNAVMGLAVTLDASGNVLVSDPDGPLIAVVGLRDTVVVCHDGVTLVCPKPAAQSVKRLVEQVRRETGERYV